MNLSSVMLSLRIWNSTFSYVFLILFSSSCFPSAVFSSPFSFSLASSIFFSFLLLLLFFPYSFSVSFYFSFLLLLSPLRIFLFFFSFRSSCYSFTSPSSSCYFFASFLFLSLLLYPLFLLPLHPLLLLLRLLSSSPSSFILFHDLLILNHLFNLRILPSTSGRPPSEPFDSLDSLASHDPDCLVPFRV